MRMMASLKVYDLIYMMIDQSNPVLPDVQSLMYLFYREAFVAATRLCLCHRDLDHLPDRYRDYHPVYRSEEVGQLRRLRKEEVR